MISQVVCPSVMLNSSWLWILHSKRKAPDGHRRSLSPWGQSVLAIYFLNCTSESGGVYYSSLILFVYPKFDCLSFIMNSACLAPVTTTKLTVIRFDLRLLDSGTGLVMKFTVPCRFSEAVEGLHKPSIVFCPLYISCSGPTYACEHKA